MSDGIPTGSQILLPTLQQFWLFNIRHYKTFVLLWCLYFVFLHSSHWFEVDEAQVMSPTSVDQTGFFPHTLTISKFLSFELSNLYVWGKCNYATILSYFACF